MGTISDCILSEGNADLPHEDGSNFKKSKTPREFAQEICEVAESFGYPVHVLAPKLNQWYLTPHDQYRDPVLDQEICELMIKIFVAMRERGYSHSDLAR